MSNIIKNKRINIETELLKNPNNFKTKKFYKKFLVMNNIKYKLIFANEYYMKILLILESLTLDVKIIFSKNYPFSKPIVIINNLEYFIYRQIDLKYEKFLNGKCLCCNSILCNWSPYFTIFDIFKEIYDLFLIKCRILKIKLCEKVVDKIFGFYLPIVDFL